MTDQLQQPATKKRKAQDTEPNLSDDQILTAPSPSKESGLVSPASKLKSKPSPTPTVHVTSPDVTVWKNLLEISGTRERLSRDEIHGNISFEPALTAIIDTPYFQRLRQVRQLGVTSFVYANATHTRFEHSLGVAHLAQKQVESLREKQENLGITKKEVLLVKMAGLCHDLGHGPYSHTFEGHLHNHGLGHVEHEQLSLDQIDAILAARGLKVDLTNLDAPLKEVPTDNIGIKAKTFGFIQNCFQENHELSLDDVITSRDILFVKECILGEPLSGNTDFIGRGEGKEYLYDIVSNRHSGKDVDKDDYYVRDAVNAFGEGRMDMLLINAARVAKIQCQVTNCFRCKARLQSNSSFEPGIHLSLAYPKKYATTVIKFFDTRQELHATIYTHKTAKSIEYMICDILAAAEPHYRIKLSDGRSFTISEATQDPEAFLKLTDRILDRIEDSEAQGLEEAKDIMKRHKWRDLYKCMWSCRLNKKLQGNIWAMKDDEIHDELMDIVREYKHGGDMEEDDSSVIEMEEDDDEDGKDGEDDINASIGKLEERDFIVEVRVIHKGKKDENPVNYVPFYDSHQDEHQLAQAPFNLPMASQAKEEEYATRNTKAYLDKTIRIFSRSSELDSDKEAKNKAIEECFKKWYERKGGNSDYPSLSQC